MNVVFQVAIRQLVDRVERRALRRFKLSSKPVSGVQDLPPL